MIKATRLKLRKWANERITFCKGLMINIEWPQITAIEKKLLSTEHAMVTKSAMLGENPTIQITAIADLALFAVQNSKCLNGKHMAMYRSRDMTAKLYGVTLKEAAITARIKKQRGVGKYTLLRMENKHKIPKVRYNVSLMRI